MSGAAKTSGPTGLLYCPACERQFISGERCPEDNVKLVRLAAQEDPFIGKDLEGRYSIVQKLGQGGMGAVYRGTQHSVGRDVAIKVVTPSLVSNPEVIKRFLRECRLSSRFSHPNAVGVLDFGQTDDGVFFLVMELVQGHTLEDVLEAEKQLKPERVVRIGAQICDALEAAHALQIIHRDLKPSNVMLLAAGRDLVKVLDFGLAKSLAPEAGQATMTNAGVLMGTPAFMPPELAMGLDCDGRADLYSLGCMLYQAGSGSLPFDSESVHELIAMHATQPAPPMKGVPKQLGVVIDKLLAKDPKDRFQSAAATREALEEALQAVRDSVPRAGTARPVSQEGTQATAPIGTASKLMSAPVITPTGTAFGVGMRPKSPSAPPAASEPEGAMVGGVSMFEARPAKPRWPLYAGLGGVALVGIIAAAIMSGGAPAASRAPEAKEGANVAAPKEPAAAAVPVTPSPAPDAALPPGQLVPPTPAGDPAAAAGKPDDVPAPLGGEPKPAAASERKRPKPAGGKKPGAEKKPDADATPF